MNWFLPIAIISSAAYLGRHKINNYLSVSGEQISAAETRHNKKSEKGRLKFTENHNIDLNGTFFLKAISNTEKLPAVYNKPLRSFTTSDGEEGPEWSFTDNYGGIYVIYKYKDRWKLGGNKKSENNAQLFLNWLKTQN